MVDTLRQPDSGLSVVRRASLRFGRVVEDALLESLTDNIKALFPGRPTGEYTAMIDKLAALFRC